MNFADARETRKRLVGQVVQGENGRPMRVVEIGSKLIHLQDVATGQLYQDFLQGYVDQLKALLEPSPFCLPSIP